MGEKDALKYYEKCLEVAKKSGEKESEGRICYKIGELYYRSEEFKKSVKYQEQYLDIIKQQLEESKKITDESKEKAETNMKTKTMEVTVCCILGPCIPGEVLSEDEGGRAD